MAVLAVCAILSAFAVSASADEEPREIIPESSMAVGGNGIIRQPGVYTLESFLIYPDGRLTICEGVTIKVTKFFECYGELELLGTLDLSRCSTDIDPETINVGSTGELIIEDLKLNEVVVSNIFGSILSEGNVWIICAVAAAAVIAVGAIVVVKKKKVES